MRLRSGAILAALTALLAATPVSFAHHSVAGQFDVSKPMTLKGQVSKVDWINPHIYLHLDVKDEKGTVTTWALATLPTAMMRRAGLTKASFQGKPGETVTVDALPARDGTRHLGWMTKITYEDGHFHQLGGQ
jgi:hypothetical protein